MDIVNFIENEDGSATLTADIDKDELSMLVSYAFNGILKEKMNQEVDNVHEKKIYI